jgi:Protein kinase domain
MEQERRIEQSNSDVSLTSIVSTELSTGYLETSMRRSRPIEAASAIQAALPPIECQNVRSKLVSKPVLQHASAPEPAKPRKLAQVNRNDLQPLDRRDGFQYDPVGPLATGRCERVVSRDWQFKGFHGQVKELGCSTDRANQNTALSTPSIADHNLSPVDPLAIGRRQPISSSSGNLIGSSDLSSDERCIRGSPVTVMSSPFGDQASFDENYSPKFRIYTPVAYKFYMEQRMDNIKKYYDERRKRSQELEKDLQRANLDDETQDMVRQILNQKESNYLRQKRAKMGARDFEKICTVGVGAFGEVVLARKKETGQYYAIKILIKSDVMERNQFAHVKAERDILAEAENEWVVKLFYSFQDSRNLYFVMEYVPGGDLMKVLQNKGQFDEPLARFYTAELVCAIGSVHALGFIHRGK